MKKRVNLLAHQYDFIEAQEKFVLLLGGIGCVHESTLIDTDLGKIAIGDIDSNINYLSFRKNEITPHRGTAPYLKGKGDLYRVIHERGEFVAYGRHLVFCSDYKYRFLEDIFVSQSLISSDLDPSCSNLVACLSRFFSDEHRLKKIISNFLGDCLNDNHQYDRPLLLALKNDPAFSPLLIDVLKSFQTFYQAIISHEDVLLAPVQGHIRRDLSGDLTSKNGSSLPEEGQSAILANYILTSLSEYILLDNPKFYQFRKSFLSHHIMQLSYFCRILSEALTAPYSTTKVLSIERHSNDWYWDLTVPIANNYVAHGCIHHNSGKTYAGALFTIAESIIDPDTHGLICANTYRQLTNATLATLFSVCDEYDINYKYNQNKGWLTIENAHWYTYSLEQYDNIRGIEVGRFHADEMRDSSNDAFTVLLGRLRDKKAKKLKGRITTSPNGYDYLHEYFVGDKKSKDFKMIRATSMDNHHLPDGYVETLKQSYDEKVYQQEVMGEFINITQGRIYYAFNRSQHVRDDIQINPNYPIYIGMDFNINPMTAVAVQAYDNRIHIVDEFWLMTSNTKEMGLEIGRKYGFNLSVVPDSTGKALKTSGIGLSDHEILRQLGFNVINSSNPFRVDRYNNVNGLLSNDRILISKKCAKVIRDLEQVSYKDGSSLPDTANKELTHISDAMGYLIYYMYPIIKPKDNVSFIPR